MTSLRDQTVTFEIILAALAAAGLVLMMISPVVGRVIVLVSLILASLCYLRCSLMVINFADEDRFTRLVLMVNMFASAVVAVMLFLIIWRQPENIALGIAAGGIIIVCIALNLAHKYIYQIKDENYFANQVRQLLLLGLVVLFLLVDSRQ
jgi:hypothetical protein